MKKLLILVVLSVLALNPFIAAQQPTAEEVSLHLKNALKGAWGIANNESFKDGALTTAATFYALYFAKLVKQGRIPLRYKLGRGGIIPALVACGAYLNYLYPQLN